jgi:hypothetical protein
VTERKALANDAKAMSTEQKEFRKVTQQKIGAYIGYIANELAKLEKAEAKAEAGESEEQEQEQVEKTPTEKLRIVLETALKIVQGDEQAKGYDPVIMAKLIGQAIADHQVTNQGQGKPCPLNQRTQNVYCLNP